ncbi:class I SAM-dependent methyltransferase [Pollutimonas sp. M17]|uniref:class I SAM-dependent methyltransferase n=1 Tax=Pollutimonas sp. M17 TaxID=2962065 RepID=UPI0021F44CC3|nr:class I SAM-dependent methyltransferase [Pollutimonas sp. M17]UYO93982.1 class I SAM-dependent methyltransferase [Pollutimonas sp. M17]
MSQKDVFLSSEADAWYERNLKAVKKIDFSIDPVSLAVLELVTTFPPEMQARRLRVLEVGCGEGRRLEWLAAKLNLDVYGIEPSALAVDKARARGITAERGTADDLPFDDATFDVLIFGFCLYLCDRQDLFRVAQEANRVLKPDSWLVINDFYAPHPIKREYHHKPGVYSYKMDYRRLFTWHPAYTCFAHKVTFHGRTEFTDDSQEWMATSVMRKRMESQ